jgi:hypothetical protein
MDILFEGKKLLLELGQWSSFTEALENFFSVIKSFWSLKNWVLLHRKSLDLDLGQMPMNMDARRASD